MYLAQSTNRGHFPDQIGIWKCWFLRQGKTGVSGEKPLGARTRGKKKCNPHMTPSPGIKPWPHWWEASALTTVPSHKLNAYPTLLHVWSALLYLTVIIP